MKTLIYLIIVLLLTGCTATSGLYTIQVKHNNQFYYIQNIHSNKSFWIKSPEVFEENDTIFIGHEISQN